MEICAKISFPVFQVDPIKKSWPNVTVIESRAVNFLLMKLRNKDTQGRVSPRLIFNFLDIEMFGVLNVLTTYF